MKMDRLIVRGAKKDYRRGHYTLQRGGNYNTGTDVYQGGGIYNTGTDAYQEGGRRKKRRRKTKGVKKRRNKKNQKGGIGLGAATIAASLIPTALGLFGLGPK